MGASGLFVPTGALLHLVRDVLPYLAGLTCAFPPCLRLSCLGKTET